MSSDEDRLNDFDLTDPKAMRALAHPARMRLLELLRDHETLTATKAAQIMGETPANCAFHLRTLAKYGFVQEAGGGRGRERPWRNATRQVKISSAQPDPQAAIAAQALGEMFRELWFDRARRSWAVSLPEPWEQARTSAVGRSHLTAGELKQVGDEVVAILARYLDRDENPELRPEGSRAVDIMFLGSPVVEENRDIS
jgi:DNA-binding transcriptional ArsR family regulator